MGLDDFARKAFRKNKRANQRKAKQAAADKKAAAKAIANGAKVDTGFHSSLSPQMKWALENPDMAKYDNDGNPVTSEHWGFEPPKGKPGHPEGA